MNKVHKQQFFFLLTGNNSTVRPQGGNFMTEIDTEDEDDEDEQTPD